MFQRLVKEMESNLDDDAEAIVIGSLKQNPELTKQRAKNGFTLLHHAIRNFRYSVAEYLATHGADANALTNEGRSPLGFFPHSFDCSENDAIGCYRILITKGAAYTDRELLVKMIYDGEEDRVIQELQKNPALLRADFSPVGSLLHNAAQFAHDVKLASYLIDRGMDVNCADQDGDTPLHRVINRPARDQEASLALVRFLVKSGANLNLRNKLGYTPLHAAARHPCQEYLKLLIELGAPINAKTNEGETALDIVYYMRFLGGRSLAHWLKKKGACSGKPKRKRS